MGENAKKIGIVMTQFSVVVKSMEKGLADRGYTVSLFQDDLNAIKAVADDTEVFIIYLQDSILTDLEQVKGLFLLCDTFGDMKRRLIFIGSDNSKDQFLKSIPSIKDHVWIARPVDMESLVKEIEKERKRLHDDREKKKILIIDDDPLYAKIIVEWLKNNYVTEMVFDGMQAISWLARNKTDLILLDYEMPIVDGPKVLEMLRSHPDTSSIPVIFLTGIGTKESISRVMGLKPQGYVLKSTSREDLLKTLSDYFEKHKYS